MTETQAADSHVMQCMEVWGGNQAVDGGVNMVGLDAWVYSRPYHDEAGGGDVYYVSSCATGRITRVLVADVSGHGEAVAETGSKLRLLMRRYVNHISHNSFVVALNREFAALADDGGFATAAVASYFAPTNTLTLCNAGHPPPLVYRARTRRWETMAHDERERGRLANVPLGLIDSTAYDERSTKLATGDLVLMFTDSLMESRTPDGRQIGMEGLLEIVRGLGCGDPAGLIPRLLERVAELDPENLLRDDVTVLLVRSNGVRVPVPFSRRVLAPLRVMGSIIGAVRPGAPPIPWPEMSLRNMLGAFSHSANRIGENADG